MKNESFCSEKKMPVRKRSLIFQTVILLLLPLSIAFSQKYVVSTARQGDGIYAMLRRYYLPTNKQYIAIFHSLNSQLFQQHGSLQVGRRYKMPIRRYVFNGKNIRSTLGISNYNLAKKIEQYNKKVHRAGLKRKSYKFDKALWVPYFYLPNVENPAEPKNGREYSIFGPKYKTIDPIDHQLEGCVYYLVSGHGGPDPGAIGLWGKHRLCEDEYAYDVMLRLGRNLLQHGAKVYIIVRDPNDGIRDERFLKSDQDEYYYGNVRISASRVARLNKRASIINSLYARNKGSARLQNVIILHVDSRSNNKRIDIFYYYKKRSRAGKSLAKLLYQTVKNKYAEVQPGRGYRGSVTTRDLHMLRKTKPTTVYIELGNIRNRRDQDRFIQQNNRQAVANWLSLGLLKASKE